MTTHPRKWNLPLTYEPKIQPVIEGDCTQSIRMGRKFKVGDLIRFYRWAGKPYRSKRETITEYMEIIEALPITIFPSIIQFPSSLGGFDFGYWHDFDNLAEADGIVPPTGEALRDVLIEKNGKIPKGGIEAQIIRWRPAHV